MLSQIINVNDINPAEIMIGAIVGQIINVVWNFTFKKFEETRPIKKLKNIKTIKALEFILAYILPFGTIIYLMVENKTEPTFKNIALFIIICIGLIFNILMSHIINLYKLNTSLSKISSDKLTKIDNAFDKVYNHIEELRTYNNLK